MSCSRYPLEQTLLLQVLQPTTFTSKVNICAILFTPVSSEESVSSMQAMSDQVCCSCLEVQHFTIVKCGSRSKICLVALWSNSVQLLPPTRWWSFDGGKLSSFFAYRVSGFPHFPPGQKQKLAECNVWVHVCILSFLCLQTACPLLCNLSNDTEETVKWIRWSDCYLFLLLFLVYCFSYSAESLIDCLCSCTLANLRLVSQSNCITVHTCRPRSAPYICATPHKEGEAYSHPAQSLWRLCRLAGKHNPIFKNHWGHCTLKSCCHSRWNHFELHHAVMSQSLQTNMEELFLYFTGFHLSCYSNVHKQRLDLFFLCVFTMCSLLTYNNNTASSVLHSWCIHKNACP